MMIMHGFFSLFVWIEFLTINFSNKFMKKLFKQAFMHEQEVSTEGQGSVCLFCVISGSGREGKDPEEWPYPVSDL